MTYAQDSAKLVKAALSLDALSYNWLVELSPPQALEFVRKAQVYNNLTVEGLVSLVEKINAEAPRLDYGPDNPNTGGTSHCYRIGSEYSRVIYVVFSDGGVHWTEKCWRNLFNGIGKFARQEAKCDELHVTKNSFQHVLRIWWD